jgi:hypothetical protein
MEENFFNDHVFNRYPFFRDIIKAANKDNLKRLIQVLEYCKFKIILTENLDTLDNNIEFEKHTESVNVKVSDNLKKKIIELSDIIGIGASTFMRQAAEFFIASLYKDLKQRRKE